MTTFEKTKIEGGKKSVVGVEVTMTSENKITVQKQSRGQ